MLELKELRTNKETLEKRLQTKIKEIDLAPLLVLDEKSRSLKAESEQLKNKRNALSKTIGENKQKGLPSDDLMKEVGTLGEKIAALDKELILIEEKLQDGLARLPNLPDPSVKVSFDPKENVCIKTHKEKPTFSFPFKNHVELNEKLDLFDFPRGAKLSGSGWPVYKNLGARLEWALINYMINTHVQNGFTQYIVPNLVKRDVMYNSGMFPKFEAQVFKLDDKDYPLCLIPTAETALNGLHADEILEEKHLPLTYVAYSPCFRREAGAAGSQERGLIRTHQFNKVELFAFCTPENSPKVFEHLLSSAEKILQGLDLHYRNMELVTGDMSFGAAKTVDIEVWLPGQNRYYEVSSVSNCTDFQARRSKIRFKKEGKTEFVHTLNGSGVATSRLMVAILENNQQEDGSVILPKVLHPYLGFDKIEAKK